MAGVNENLESAAKQELQSVEPQQVNAEATDENESVELSEAELKGIAGGDLGQPDGGN